MYLLDWPGGSWQTTAEGVALIIGTYIAAFWLALVFWAARDIRQRSSSGVVQFAGAMLVLCLFLPGLWIYLMMRPRRTRAQRYAQMLEEEALRLELDRQVACPACARRVREDYLVCPACRTELKEACASCSKPLANAWVVCPYCLAERDVEEPERVEERERVPAQAQPAPVPQMTAVDVNGLAS